MEVLDLKAMAEQAVALHQQGQLEQAEALYFRIMNADPALFGPRYYLGLLRLQQGRHAEACDCLEDAVKILPGDLGALMNFGMALRASNRAEEAVSIFDRALAVQPNLAEAHYNRGVALGDLQRYETAVESYDRALTLQPEMAAAMINRAAALAAMQRNDDAIQGYDRALAMLPGNALALMGRGLVHRAMGQPQLALTDYERALAIDPTLIEAQYNRGVTLLDLHRAGEALTIFDTVMSSYHNNAEMLNNRGVALWNLKRPAEALESCDRAVAIEPDFAEAWGNRGLALRDLMRFDEARACFDQVLRLEPRNAVAWNSRGTVLRDIKNYEGAIESYSKAIEFNPDYAEALVNRGYACWTLKHYEAGIADVERGLALNPDHPYGLGELLHYRMYSADWQDLAKAKGELERQVRAGKRAVQPFIFQAITESPQDAQTCSRIWAGDKYPQQPSAPHDRATRQGDRKIRIGYLSGEFRQQATAILMTGLYECHDREAFEIIALDAGANDGSEMRARLEKSFDRWMPIAELSDREAAQAIRAAEIDILVNLNGYFGDARMGILAQRPAPVQVNYLGFPATLGAPYIDYIIADRTVIPEDEKCFYDEQVVYLPGSYQANDDKGRAMAPTPSRTQAGLPEKAFVFCNFNNAYKLTPETFDSWMRILSQVEGSVLWLLDSTTLFAGNLRREAEKRGVAQDRLIFAPDLATDEHLARLALADLFLDGLPYNAHTTASDALWAGVPLITLRGTTFPGRVAASLLSAAGLSELVTENRHNFEARAVNLARDSKTMEELRGKVAKARGSALFDTATFTRHIENAYRTMWKNTGKKPESFAVES
jgi:predicted O-linked N-acetylglucosamine transferase (SPINDLY family)